MLKAISEQTGMTFTVEPRKYTRWRVTLEK
jgi:hypothetical protein